MEKTKLVRPVFYFIVPAYNAGQYLEQCLDSIASQSVKKKVIVVNDCSKDTTEDIAKKFLKYKDFVLIKNENNIGVSLSRNKALDFVSNDKVEGQSFIGFVDGDDYIDNACEIENCILETGADVVLPKRVEFIESGTKNRKLSPEFNIDEEAVNKLPPHEFYAAVHEATEDYILFNSFSITNKDLIENAKIRFEDTLAEDVMFSTRVHMQAKNPKVCYDKPYYFYRMTDGTRSVSKLEELAKVHFEFSDNMIALKDRFPKYSRFLDLRSKELLKNAAIITQVSSKKLKLFD